MLTANKKSGTRNQYFLCHNPGEIASVMNAKKVSGQTSKKSIVEQVIIQLTIEGVPLSATSEEILTTHLELIKIAALAISHDIKPIRMAEFFECNKKNLDFYF